MAGNATGTRQSSSSKVPAASPQGSAVKQANAWIPGSSQSSAAASVSLSPSPSSAGTDSSAKHSGYGLPCAKCRLYYSADLDICPTCHHHERVSAVVPKTRPKVTQALPDPVPDGAVVEKEREEFLRQFKSNLIEAHAGVANASGVTCSLGEHHPGDDTAAVICKSCFERVQERLDMCETALLADPKEAAQIIYDAVWADPSDPAKTYENAANALLSEIRKRAGMSPLMGPFEDTSRMGNRLMETQKFEG